MWMRVKMIVLFVCLLLLLSTVGSARDLVLTISPEMELLAGVLSQTTWIERRGPEGSGNEYYRALYEFFTPYRDHQAVKLAQGLTDRGFTYDAPPAFIVHLGPLPELELAHEYSAYLIKRAGNRDRLEEFRLALKDLAAESRFLDFYTAWQPYLADIVAECSIDFNPQAVRVWLEEFFGWQGSEFHLILAPAMFPGGGYGATVTTAEGEMIAYQITREWGISATMPQFQTGRSLEQLTIHELGHSFVNPSLEAHPHRVRKLKPLLYRVREEMRSQAYGDIGSFLNEQVLRAAEVLAAKDLYGVAEAKATLQYNEARGFYLTQFVVEQLEYYRSNREQYPTFRDYAPYLFARLEHSQRQNCSLWEKLWGLWPW